MTRREVREVTFMMLFQLEFRQDISIEDTLAQYYTIDIERMVNEYVKVSINRNFGAISFEIDDMEYIKSILLCMGK